MSDRVAVRSALNRQTLMVSDGSKESEDLRDQLTALGFEVRTVRSYGEAFVQLQIWQPTIILVDERMALGAGLDVCRGLWRHHDMRSVPIVVFGGTADPASRGAARTAGATGNIEAGTSMETTIQQVLLYSRLTCSERELRNEQRRNDDLTAELLSSGEHARLAYASDLHDEIGHILFEVSLYLDRYSSPLSRLTPRGRKGAALADDVSEASMMVSAMIGDVESRSLEPGRLADRIQDMAGALSSQFGTKCTVRLEGDLGSLDEHVEELLYRFFREGLSNVVRHSGASKLTIEVTADEENATARLADDGRGFDMSALKRDARRAHFGLLLLQRRLHLAGGSMSIVSRPGNGTELTMSLPTRR